MPTSENWTVNESIRVLSVLTAELEVAGQAGVDPWLGMKNHANREWEHTEKLRVSLHDDWGGKLSCQVSQGREHSCF